MNKTDRVACGVAAIVHFALVVAGGAFVLMERPWLTCTMLFLAVAVGGVRHMLMDIALEQAETIAETGR